MWISQSLQDINQIKKNEFIYQFVHAQVVRGAACNSASSAPIHGAPLVRTRRHELILGMAKTYLLQGRLVLWCIRWSENPVLRGTEVGTACRVCHLPLESKRSVR